MLSDYIKDRYQSFLHSAITFLSNAPAKVFETCLNLWLSWFCYYKNFMNLYITLEHGNRCNLKCISRLSSLMFGPIINYLISALRREVYFQVNTSYLTVANYFDLAVVTQICTSKENSPHWFINLNVWSLVSRIVCEGLGGVTLLKQVQLWWKGYAAWGCFEVSKAQPRLSFTLPLTAFCRSNVIFKATDTALYLTVAKFPAMMTMDQPFETIIKPQSNASFCKLS